MDSSSVSRVDAVTFQKCRWIDVDDDAWSLWLNGSFFSGSNKQQMYGHFEGFP